MDKTKRMGELIRLLEAESVAYYLGNESLVTDHEWDAQLAELAVLENETGIILGNSPLHKVSGGVVEGLAKVHHSKPMLSCDKDKDRQVIFKFCIGKAIMVSFKMDGLTIVARYKNGKLMQLITRGDGDEGEDITHNAAAIYNLPQEIPYLDELEVRGEGVISWSDFNEYNENSSKEVSHPRNLASGSVRLLNRDETHGRHVAFIAFELVAPYLDCRKEQYDFLAKLGFPVVPHKLVPCFNTMEELNAVIDNDFDPRGYAFPVDGVIFDYNDVAYGKSLGATGHHENCRFALKWEDEEYETVFRGVELNPTRTGKVSLTALFDPVTIDGAVVKRATLHNMNFFRNLQLGEGDTIKVYKANMIIPAIASNLTKSGTYQISDKCPCCDSDLYEDNGVLICPNEDCTAKHLRQLIHFVSKPCMNIVGLSKRSLTQLVDAGCIHTYADLFHLDQYRNRIQVLDGWGKSSCQKLLDAVETARHTTLARLIPSFGIEMVGKRAGKTIHKYFHGDVDVFMAAIDRGFDFHHLPDFGDVMCKNLTEFFADPKKRALWDSVLAEVVWFPDQQEQVPVVADNPFTGMTVVATGSFVNFSRTGINEKLESLGAKAGSSVSKKTDYVIAGEKAGSKLTKARDLGVPVLTEDEFLQMIG